MHSVRLRGLLTGILFCLLVAVGSAALPVRAQAQTATSSAQGKELQTVVPISQQISDLRAIYRQKLNEYRNYERLASIAKEQYTKLQTLTSLEEAVKATQKVMFSRAEVLETYVSLLRLTLKDTQGLELQIKGAELAKIDLLADDIKRHKVQVEAASDRKTVGQMVIRFAELRQQIEQTTYEVLCYIAYGEMQAVYNNTLLFRNEVKAYVEKNETNALRLAEKKRGIDEIDSNLKTVITQLEKVKQKIKDDKVQKTQPFYSQTVQDLSEVYGGVSRAHNYLGEVLK